MKGGRQNSARAPSVRTSSSHRSTIETRGVPEFDRDYARQLSVAKRGRTGSVKASPRTGSTHESPLEETGIGHFPGSAAAAAAAATRIKDYVATHVTPPRPFQSNTPHRHNESAGTPSHNASNAVGSPTGVAEGHRSPSPAGGANSSSTFLFGAAAPSANEEGANDTNSPPNTDSLNSTRRGSVASSPDLGRSDGGEEKVWLVAVKTVVICLLSFFVLLCAVSFLASSDKDYNPSYFSFSGGAKSAAAAPGSAPRSFPDRMIPEFNRQLALHTRRLLGQLFHMLGVMKVLRFFGRMVRGFFKPFRMLWTIVKDGIVSPIMMVLPRVDVSMHPTLRYIFSQSTEDAEGWSISKGGAVVGAITRSLLQMFIEPVFIIGRTLRTVGSGFSQSIQLFSVPLMSQNTTQASPLQHNATAPIRAGNRGSRASVMSRATSHVLLTMWRPMHRLWALVVPLAVDNTTSSSDSWTKPLRNFTPPQHRNVSEAHEKFAPNHTEEKQKDTSPSPSASAPGKAEQESAIHERQEEHQEQQQEHQKDEEREQQVPSSIRTSHTQRLAGNLWGKLLEQHADKLRQLAQEDLRELLGRDVTVEDVRLRPGSLVMDFTAAGPLAAKEQPAGKSDWQRAAQSQRDAQLAHGHFGRLQAFYDEAAASLERDREAAAAAAAAQCDERVTLCQQDYDGRVRQSRADLQACEEASKASQQTCETSRASAQRESAAALQACEEAKEACQLNATDCAAHLAEVTKALEERTSEQHDTAAALAGVQEALVAATAGFANETDAERQRCGVKVAEATQNCTRQLHELRAALLADYTRDVEAKRQACEAEMLKLGEEKCSGHLRDQARAMKEDCADSLGHAEAQCASRLAQKVAEVNHTSMEALRELQQRCNSSTADSTRRLDACESARKKAETRWAAERQESHDAAAAQLAAAQATCQETERHVAAEACAKQLAAQAEALHATCNATLRETEVMCRAQLTHDLAAVNSSAATTLAQLRATLAAAHRAAEDGVAACEGLRAVEAEAAAATQRRLNASCAAQLLSARESCDETLQTQLAAERLALRNSAEANWTRQKAALTAQCSHDAQRAVAEAVAAQQALHATKLQEATVALQAHAADELRKVQKATEEEREAAKRRHASELHSCEAHVATCVGEQQAAEAAHVKAAAETRTQLFVYLADSGEAACLRMTAGHDASGCAAQRRKIEAALHSLPPSSTPVDALAGLQAHGHGAASTGSLTWNFTGSGLRLLPAETAHRKGAAMSWLHVTGMIVGLASAAYAIFRRQRDRRLYKDTIAQLNALIAANETTMAVRSPLPPRPRRGRLGTAAAAFADDAPVSWAAAAACLDNCAEALDAWHSTSCAVLYEQAAHALLQSRCDAQQSLLSNSLHSPSEITQGDVPATSVVSASTLPLTEVDASRANAMPALTQMHETFVGTYYNILEMYYVDLLNAVANRELAESQLQEAESVASRQATILHKQSAAVTQLKRALAEKEKELSAVQQHQRAAHPSAANSVTAADSRLAREERKTAAQQAMIALLEEQLQVSKEELSRARGAAQASAGRTPRGEAGAESASALQVRSLQELANAENNSTNSSDFSNANRSGLPRSAGASATTSPSKGQLGGVGAGRAAPAATSHKAPVSALKKPTTMVRDPESTRRFHKLRWNDESGPE